MNKSLNIVSFDYPFPPNYGGVIDVFYKIKALKHLGISIHLHYFAEEEKHDQELESLCKSVHFYPKSSLWSPGAVSNIPLRMLVRRNVKLAKHLSQSNYPILYEGLHTSFTAKAPSLSRHKKYLRCHNIEADYALQLSQLEKNFFKKNIFNIEAKRTQKYEKDLTHFSGLFCLSQEDTNHFITANPNVRHIPVFHAHSKVDIKKGLGDYILFHGNLSVVENMQTAMWIVRELAPKNSTRKFIIAGKSNHADIGKKLTRNNVECVLNPHQEQMKTLIQNAQIVLLKTAVPSGIKLKLIDSLALSRHIIADENSVKYSGLQSQVNLAYSNQEFIDIIDELMPKELTSYAIEQRENIFKKALNNEFNASKIIDEIFYASINKD